MVSSTLPVRKMIVFNYMWATSKEAERRGQGNTICVAQG